MTTDRIWEIITAPILGRAVRDRASGDAVCFGLDNGINFASIRAARTIEYAPTLLRLLDTLVNNHPSLPGYEAIKHEARELVAALKALDDTAASRGVG
jgi:hypothetical protein